MLEQGELVHLNFVAVVGSSLGAEESPSWDCMEAAVDDAAGCKT